jgi:hypothetical protein
MKVTIGPYKDDDSPRREEIVIHDYDTWSADHTLSLIILPLLKKLKEDKHGSPIVDQEDVPQNLRTTYPAMYNGQLDLFNTFEEIGDMEDPLIHARWDYVLNEMIWAHEQIVADIDWELEMNHDWSQRLKNGLNLFGKYYQSLWT